ncbi:MAG: c-type cytochrome biogenesis protein CcsB [Actinomycetales bacterium]|nr:c-type cytochrome biogenesis protein CcsB [Actinomycetales bacterium]
MTDQTLAQASDIAVWATMVVLTLAMLAFAAHLAVTGTRVRDRSSDATAEGSAGSVASEGSADDAGAVAVLAPEEAEPPAPSRRWGIIGLQLTWLATFGLIAGVALRGLSVGRAPLGNMYEFAIVAVMFTLIVYSAWSLRQDRLWLGLFITLPATLILAAAKLSWYTEASQLMPSLNSIWLVIHVTVATLSVALFTIGCALALLYLAKDRAEAKGEVPNWLAALPSAPSLERITYGLHIVAFPLWTFTLIAGAIWAEQAWGRYWGWDPKEVWTFVIWVVYAAYLHARATSGWTARKATWLAVAGFGCIIVNYAVVNVFFVGWHSYSGL